MNNLNEYTYQQAELAEDTLRQLYASHADVLFHLLNDQCQDKQLARQVLKETFEQLYDVLKMERLPKNPIEWLKDIAVSDLHRRMKKSDAPVDALKRTVPAVETGSKKVSENLQNEASAQHAYKQEHETEALPPHVQPATKEDAQQAIADVRKRGLRETPGKQKNEKGFLPLLILMAVLLLIVMWYITGKLIQMRILPPADLGYEWFNTHVFRLF